MQEPESNQPIFVIGVPRSGTTLLLDILATHESLAWVSNWTDRYPKRTWFTALNRIYDISGVGNKLYRLKTGACIPYMPYPVEPWHFWCSHLSSFRRPRTSIHLPQRQVASDLPEHEAEGIRKAVHSICRWHGRRRFLSKYTDFPRITYLSRAFPDATFIHIVRDGRAVAYSYAQRMQTETFSTWKQRDWFASAWPQAWQEHWKHEFHTPLGLAAYLWLFFMSEIMDEADSLPANRYIEIEYENLLMDPESTMAQIEASAGLTASQRVRSHLTTIHLENMNTKWENNLSQREKILLNTVIAQRDQSREQT